MLTKMDMKKEWEKAAIIIHLFAALKTEKCGTLNHAQTKASPNRLCGPIEIITETRLEKAKK